MNAELDGDVTELLQRIDANLSIVESVEEGIRGGEHSRLPAKYSQLASNLESMRETVASGKMPRPSRGDVPAGTGLALRKWVGEWCDHDEVLDKLQDIDAFYRDRY